MTKIKLNQENPKYFHPRPSPKQTLMLKMIQVGLNWEYPKLLEKITREEAKSIIERGIKAARRRKINLIECYGEQ